jgi:hypothetical protein
MLINDAIQATTVDVATNEHSIFFSSKKFSPNNIPIFDYKKKSCISYFYFKNIILFITKWYEWIHKNTYN